MIAFFGHPGLGVVAVLDVLVGLGVVAGGAGAHVALDHAGGHGLAESSACWICTGCAPISSAILAVAGL